MVNHSPYMEVQKLNYRKNLKEIYNCKIGMTVHVTLGLILGLKCPHPLLVLMVNPYHIWWPNRYIKY